jgi:RNA exonuclease 4
VAIDCEMVGVGPDGKDSALARVSIVNFHGHVVLDDYVKPKERVTDYRTHVSGITKQHLTSAITFEDVQKRVADILTDKILVGHSVHNDLKALMLSHPRSHIRDTSKFPLFQKMGTGRTPGLRHIAKHVLGIEIQQGQHSSVEDARVVMEIYKKYRKQWT